MADRQSLLALKESLIGDALSYNDMGNIINTLISRMDVETEERKQILVCDCISIWITKSMKSKSTDPECRFTKDHSERVFLHVLHLGGKSTGPLANSLSTLLTKTIALLKIYDAHFQETCKSWIDRIMELPEDSKQKYMLIEKIGGIINTPYISIEYGNFPAAAIKSMATNRLANAVSKALRATWSPLFVEKATKDLTASHWVGVWFDSVAAGLANLELRSNLLTYLVPLLVKKYPDSYGEFLQKVANELGEFSSDLVIGVMKVGQDLGCLTPLTNLISILEPLLTHQNSDFRTRALQLLLGSRKSSDKIPPETFQFILQNKLITLFLLENETIESQNGFTSSIRQFLIRVRDSSRAAQKAAKPGPGENKYVSECMHFVSHLLLVSKRYMFPEASFAQHSCALQLLEILIETGGAQDANPQSSLRVQNKNALHNKSEFPFFVTVFDDCVIRCLFDDLASNYRFIREHSEILLLSCDPKKTLTVLEEEFEKLFNRAVHLLADYKGRSSEGGAFVIKIIFQIYLQNGKAEISEELLHRLLLSLDSQVKCLATAGFDENKPNASHGLLQALGMICLSAIESGNVSFLEIWKSSTPQIIANVTDIWNAVSMNLQTVAAVQEEDSIAEKKIVTFGWKAVKESSKLLLLFMTAAQQREGFINREWLNHCASILMEQLTTIKHRGAFSSVYPCFISLCKTCNVSYPDLPLKWLSETLEMIKSRDQLISRRSGGIPYLITAVLASHPDGGKEIQNHTIDQLIEIAESPYEALEDGKRDLPQVHAFNILRQIFSDPLLSSGNPKKVGDALRLSLCFFVAKNWSIRNCSMMLFSTVYNRIFQKNEQTLARYFFSTHEELRRVLTTSIESLLELEKYDLIFPVLQIVAKLSFLDLQDETYSEFCMLLTKCLCVKTWKVREMAALALAVIILPKERESCVEDMMTSVTSSNDANYSHGALLTILAILRKLRERPEGLSDKAVDLLLSNSVSMIFCGKCWTTRNTALSIFQALGGLAEGACLVQLFKDECKMSYSTLDGTRDLFLTSVLRLILDETKETLGEVSSLIKFVFGLGTHDNLRLFTLQHIQEKNMPYDLFAESLIEIVFTPNWRYLQMVALSLVLELPTAFLQVIPSEALRNLTKTNKNKTEKANALNVLLSKKQAPEEFKVILSQVLALLDDEEPESVRQAALRAAIRAAFSCEHGDDLKTISFANMLVFDCMWDDSEDIREMAGSALSASLGLPSTLAPYLVAGKFVESFPNQKFDPEAICTYFVDCEPDVTTCLQCAIKNQESSTQLFETEDVNLYKNNIDRVDRSVELLQRNRDYLTDELMQKMVVKIQKDVDRIANHIQRMGQDGPVGWLRGRYEFEAVYCTVLRANALEDITGSKMLDNVKTMAKSQRLHPSIMSLLD